MANSLQIPVGYPELLQELKARIHAAQLRASFAVSRELVLLYWSIGREILTRQDVEGWGAKVVERLAHDLQTEFPGVEGFSPRNLKYMKSLAEAWPEPEIVPQLVALLPWGHLRVLLDRVKDRETRDWYLRAGVEYGWSRNVLALQISSRLHEREGKALTNFQRSLPPPDSDLAEQILKDPYNFDFLTVTAAAHEREVERGLLLHLRDLLLELGRGFCLCRQPGAARSRRSDLLHGPALLPCAIAFLLCHRVENWPLQAGVGRKAELLPFGGGRSHAHRAGRPHHRPVALRKPQQPGRRIRTARYSQAHRRLHLPSDARTAGAGAGRAADCRGPAGRRHQAAQRDEGATGP